MRRLLADHRHFSIILILFVTCSLIAFGMNALFFHYPGNYYYPYQIPWIFCILCLTYSGAYLQYGEKSEVTKRAGEVLWLFIYMALIIIGCMAIQSTPFNPIDRSILNWSEWMHIDLAELVHWSKAHPVLYRNMEVFYDSISLQMTYLPLLLILFGYFNRLHEYYFLLLATALIGYIFYYFFPTTAPASIIASPDFTEAQRATGLKFQQIHAHINPTTREGGLIALPSFHVIWAWLCAYLIRDWRFAFVILLTLNIGVAMSCVLLGWHYILDVAASAVVLFIAHYMYSKAYPTTG